MHRTINIQYASFVHSTILRKWLHSMAMWLAVVQLSLCPTRVLYPPHSTTTLWGVHSTYQPYPNALQPNRHNIRHKPSQQHTTPEKKMKPRCFMHRVFYDYSFTYGTAQLHAPECSDTCVQSTITDIRVYTVANDSVVDAAAPAIMVLHIVCVHVHPFPCCS